MAQKTYTYKSKNYMLEVVGEGIVGVVALPVCIWAAIVNLYNMGGLFIVFGIAAAYLVFNTYVARCYVKKVSIDDESHHISFEAIGSIKTYDISSLKEFRVREYPSSGKIYLRVEGHSILGGRYWINTASFENGRELFDQIRDIEFEIHPDSLKAKARKSNETYIRAYGFGRKKRRVKNRS